MGVSKAHAGEEEPRERLACVDGNPVDEIAVEEGDLLRGALAATIDTGTGDCGINGATVDVNRHKRTIRHIGPSQT